jgi:UDP-N-acetylglucosamine pyrophosphorylase
MDLENVEETVSQESSDKMFESERSETSVLPVDGWEDVTMGDKKPKHLLKMQGHNSTSYQMQGRWIVLVYFTMTCF